MATPLNPATNVVSLPTGNAAWPPVLATAWSPIQSALVQGWENWAQASDDALFGRSERGEEANDFFEGMRLLRRNRVHIERDFWSRLRKNTDRWFQEAAPTLKAVPQGPAQLSLVENEDLEETLAVTAMGDRAIRDAGSQWQALLQRLNHALQVPNPSEDLPFGPLAIAAAFRLSLDQLEGMTVPVRLVLLKLFERHAWAAISQAATEANQSLSQSGILPHLSAPALHRAERAHEGRASVVASTLPGQGDAPFLDQVPHRDTEGLPSQAELLQLLAQLRPWAQASAGLNAPNTTSFGSLMDTGGVELMAPSQWRHKILDQLPAASRHQDHERAIDLVALVFEFLLKDSVLPMPVQALLGRLQLPYLRVAVLDPHGFAQAQHSARQLLDTLTQTGQVWSEAEDPAGQRFEALKATVQTLLDASDDDLGVFDRENEAWKERLSHESKRQQQFEQRAVQVQEGQDRRVAAQHDVAQAMTDRLGEVALPPLLRGLITQHWGAALTLFWLRHGPQSTEYRRGVFVMDQLKFVAQANRSPQSVQLALRMSTGLEKTLHEGWTLLGLTDENVARMTHGVLAYIADRLGTEPPTLPGSVSAAEPVLLPEITAPVEAPPKPEPLPLAPEAERQVVSEIATGAWIEFEHQGAVHRGKLSWISPFNGRWLVVSSKGLKVADLDPQDVARQLASGQARILPDQSLVQRALAAQGSPDPAKEAETAKPPIA